MAITNNNTGESFKGCVLSVYGRDYRAMSDVWTWATFADVWDGTQVRSVLVNANFECDQNDGKAVEDATPEVLAAVENWTAEKNRVAAEQAALASAKRLAAAEAAPKKGRVVEVFKGRKIPVGTVGYVFWEGTDSYGNAKIGIATSTRKVVKAGSRFPSFVDVVWVAASNCRAVPNQADAVQPWME